MAGRKARTTPDSDKVKRALSNWLELNRLLRQMNEAEMQEALEIEKKRVPPRGTFLRRLYQSYSACRRRREEREIGALLIDKKPKRRGKNEATKDSDG